MHPNTSFSQQAGGQSQNYKLLTPAKNIIILIAFALTFHVSAQIKKTGGEQLIVKLKKEFATSSTSNTRTLGSPELDAISNSLNAINVAPIRFGKNAKQQYKLIQFPKGTNMEQAIAAYQKSGRVEYAVVNERDFIQGTGVHADSPNDQHYGLQWALSNDGSFSMANAKEGADIDMELAWKLEVGSSEVVVGIIDSGLKLDHSEFSGRIWTNADEIAGNNIDDDHNGYVDDVQGWDFVNYDNNPTDDEGHGTAVTSVIGANGNNFQMFTGMDWHCKLMPVKTLDDEGFGDLSWIVESITYAVDNGADIINLSLGTSSNSPAFADAIQYAHDHHVVVVAAMGNAGNNTTSYPAGYEGVIAVGATNSLDNRCTSFIGNSANGSSHGAHISVTAPGDYIAVLRHTANNTGGYAGGTSVAAPHVSGLAALLLSQDPDRTPAEIRSIIESSAEDQVGNSNEDIAGWDPYYGHGRINAHRALSGITSIDKKETVKTDIRVYPTPSAGPVTIELPEQFNGTGTVYNELGQAVHRFEMNAERMILDEPLSTGMYILVLQSESKMMSTKIVIE